MSIPTIRIQSTRFITFIYFLLLLYTLAALIWWGISLMDQSREITRFEINNLTLTVNPSKHSSRYKEALRLIYRQQELRRWKFWGEGSVFLLVILVGAFFVYRSVRKQIKFSRLQNNFMMAVTHELKSPIAVAKLNLDTLILRKLDESRQLKLVENTVREISRLDLLCNNMLLASQFDSHQYRLIMEPMDLGALVARQTEEFRHRTESHRIELASEPGLWVRGDPLLLGLCLNNLLENAVKYSPRDSLIRVRLYRERDQLLLEVSDEGEGIPEQEKNRIFGRFYRIGNENTRRSKGTGLGLYLVQKIVHHHGGRVGVRNKQPKGSIFVLQFPFLEFTPRGSHPPEGAN